MYLKSVKIKIIALFEYELSWFILLQSADKSTSNCDHLLNGIYMYLSNTCVKNANFLYIWNFDRKMGCISSKQKKTETKEAAIKNATAKTKRPTKAELGKVQSPSEVLESKSTVRKQINNDEFSQHVQQNQQQRSVTPPPMPASAKSNKRSWTDEEFLCKAKCIDIDTSSNIVRMFDEGNTIPFMCRYRRELIGNLSADEWVYPISTTKLMCLQFVYRNVYCRMRDIKITYNHIKNIRARASTIIKDLEKRDLLDDEIEDEIFAAKSLDALDHLVSWWIWSFDEWICCDLWALYL